MSYRSRITLLLFVVGWTPSGAALAKKPPRCPDGSYVVVGQRLLGGDPGGAPIDMVEIAGRRVSIASGCPPRKGMVQGTRSGTKVLAKWGRCGELRRIVLKALIDTACRNLTGTIKWKGTGAQTFAGIEVSQVTTTTIPTTTILTTTIPTTTIPAETTTSTTTITTTTTGGGGGTTSTTLRSCTDAERAQVVQVVATGGVLEFPCGGGSITLEAPLVVDGVAVTLRAPSTPFGRSVVTLQRDSQGLAPPFRLFEVRGGGSLTLEGISLRNGLVLGGNGAGGQDGANGTSGTEGMHQDNNPGIPGGMGTKGGAATEAVAGQDGQVARGGALLIQAGSTVVLRDCQVQGNGAVGGRGGAGGPGGRGGQAGPGGRGGPGPGRDAGAGGIGGIAGEASEGTDGGAGGEGEGGAIHNAGTLTIARCTVQGNFVTGGMPGRGAFGGTGGGGGGGGLGGSSTPTNLAQDNQGKGGAGGVGLPGTDGKRGGDGGNGGNAFGGAVYNEGTLAVTDSEFRNNFATATDGAYGASAGAGGGGGFGNTGGGGKPGGKGGNGGDGGSGALGGSNGDGGSAAGGAIFSTGPVTLSNVVFRKNANGIPSNTVGAGSGGLNNCTPGSFTCFGAGGPPGIGGTAGSGGSSAPLGAPPGANGTRGADGAAGSDGQPGAPGLAGDPECVAAGARCS